MAAEAPGLEAKYDILIRGGSVFDGSGSPGRAADVGILGDRIAAIGDLSGAHAGRVLAAEGLSVAPGFVDIHTHSDISVIYDPGQASALAMGVTSQVTGNCALSIGLALDNDLFAFERRWIAPHRGRITWKTFGEHLSHVEGNGVATNYIPLVGHGTLRKRIVGIAERPPDGAEFDAMRREVAAAMEAGAWGLSSGLEYPPSLYADTAELTDLCRVAAQYGGFYATHLRNEGDTLVEAVQEALDVAEGSGAPLQLSHHKAEGKGNWGKVHVTLGMVDAARARGVDVQLDQYPYTAFMTSLAIQTLPNWVLGGSMEDTLARLTDAVQRPVIIAELLAAHPDWAGMDADSPWHNIRIGVCRGRSDLQGLSIVELARASGKTPIDAVLDLLVETGGFVSAVNFAIGETDIAEVLRYPWTAIGSDGVGTHPGGKAGKERIHPRAYGTFPRVLGRYVREQGIIAEAVAVHKMTGLPAARLGLKERGLLQPGWYADVTVYNPRTVNDRATFDAPHQFATGIEYVIVNGHLAFEHGKPHGIMAGRVLRKNA